MLEMLEMLEMLKGWRDGHCNGSGASAVDGAEGDAEGHAESPVDVGAVDVVDAVNDVSAVDAVDVANVEVEKDAEAMEAGLEGAGEESRSADEIEGSEGSEGSEKSKENERSSSSSREALMRIALETLQRDGVLAGLNVSKVAKEVGVTPANVYHFFGSRRGLLRDAIRDSMAKIRHIVIRDHKWPDRPGRMFRIISQHPYARLYGLLAIDGDPDFVPSPFLKPEQARKLLENEFEHLPEGTDVEMLFHILWVGSLGYAIFREGAASQLGISIEDLDSRAEAVLGQLVHGIAPPQP